MLIGSLLSTIFLLWMIAKVWKQSIGLAILSFFFWPVLIYALFKNWGDEESDIKVPFFLFLASVTYMFYDMRQMARALKEDQESLLWVMQYLG
jgi:hypothetical protein